MTRKDLRARGEILRAVVALTEQRRDGRLPARLPDGTAVVPGAFRDELDLLGALLLRWHARLSGNLERALAEQPLDLEAAVIGAWARTAGECPGLRRVVDHCLEEPVDEAMAHALGRARRKEWARLAAAAGLACDESRAAVEAGHRIELAARAAVATGSPQAA